MKIIKELINFTEKRSNGFTAETSKNAKLLFIFLPTVCDTCGSREKNFETCWYGLRDKCDNQICQQCWVIQEGVIIYGKYLIICKGCV